MPPRPPDRSPASGDPARQRLIDVGIQTFSEKGFDGTTTRDIASAVGLSPASLYVHFRSKEQLLYVISKTGHEYIDELVRAALDVSDDPVEQMGALAELCTAGHLRRYNVARVVHNELERLAADHQDELLAMRTAMLDRITATIGHGVERGVFSVPDVDVAGVAVSSLITDSCRWYRPNDEDEVLAVATRYRVLVLAMLGHRA